MITSFFILLEQICLYFPLIVGAYVSVSLLKVPDLSLEAAFVCGSILGAKMLSFTQGLPLWQSAPLVLMVSVVGGMLVGICSGLLTQYGRLPHLLSSILTTGIFHGVNQLLLGGANMPLSGLHNILIINDAHEYPELACMFVVAGVILLFGYMLTCTQLGYSLAIYGNNPEFFRYYGISQRYVFLTGIIMANGLAGLSGYFVAQTSGFVDINTGFGMILFCVTALIIGKTIIFWQPPLSVSTPLAGIGSYCFLQQLLLKVGFNLKYFTMVQSIIVVMLLIYHFKKTMRSDSIDNLGV